MYPMGLQLAGRRVLVVGGGTVAHRRIPRLLDEGADILLVAPTVHTSLQGLAESDALTWRQRPFIPSDLAGAWLVLAASNDTDVNTEISRLAEDVRIFCVRADDAGAATARTPAVTRDGALTVATFADGDPRRSAALRDTIAAGLADGSLTAPRFRATETPQPAVTLVGAGPGDPELITVAGRRALDHADVVIADRLAPATLLENLREDVTIIDAAKLPYGRQAGQAHIIEAMLAHAKAGRRVVRLKGGDGFVFGRGAEEMDACTEAGLAVRVIPGVSSALAGPALAGIPVTERGLVHEFTVVSGHVPPDDPTSLVDWPAVARLRGTVVLLMAVRNLAAITAAMLVAGKAAATPAAAVMDASTPRQRVVSATLGSIADAAISAPAVIVIGEVARRLRTG